MKSLLALLTFAPLLALGEESYFFKYPKGGPKREIRIEDSKLHAITPIEKMPPLKAASIYASHAGLGKGREYQIQIDLVDKPEGNGVPMVKLGDEVITGGIYMSMSPGDGKRMVYRWHTVELASGKILGEGMTIENGKVSPESGVKTK